MSNMVVEVTFVLRTDLLDALKEAKDKVVQWKVYAVHFDFNGWSFLVTKDSDPLEMYEEWKNG